LTAVYGFSGTEIRNHAKQYFDFVESGESVRVLRDGNNLKTSVLPEK
jgi:hypothetical protein